LSLLQLFTFAALLNFCRCIGLPQLYGSVVDGFPVYVDDPETYMHLRRSDLMMASNEEKNVVTILNELYYESAVYTVIHKESEHPDGLCTMSVTVDGITAHGHGVSRKEAKTSAACAAVKQLRCLGILQKRIAEKESIKAERKTAIKTAASEKPTPYRHTVCSVVPDNAIAKLNHFYKGLNYNVTDTKTVNGQTWFTMRLNVNGQDFTGTGRSKSGARRNAAENALRALNMWTAEDDAAKKQAHLLALAAQKVKSSVNVGTFGMPVSRGPQLPGFPQEFQSLGNIRGKPTRARGVVRGQPLPSSGTFQDRGSFLGGQTPDFLSTGFTQPDFARGRGQSFRARGSGMLRRGTRGGVRGALGAAANVEIQREKNPVMILNEVYYSAAVYEFLPSVEPQTDNAVAAQQYCTVSVDGITAYGCGPSKKDAKLDAASIAVQQLEAAGILQKRLADKAAFMSQKYALNARMHRGNPVPGRSRVARGNAISGRSIVARGRPVSGSSFARGRATSGRNSIARGRGSRVARGRGLHNVQSWYPQKTTADFNTDFTTFDTDSFISFDTNPNNGTAAASQYRAPRTASSGRRPGRMLNY